LESRQTRVFCLFENLKDIDSFFLSDLALSDILRCIISIKKEGSKPIGFQEAITQKYDVKLLEIPSLRQKKSLNPLLEEILKEK